MTRALNDEQTLLRDATVRFIEGRCPLTRVRELADGPRGVDDDYVRQGAELGWFASFVPESMGGGSVSGSPVLDARVVAEERGRRLQPGPFAGPNVVAAALAGDGADRHADVLTAIAAGTGLATWAAADPTGDYEPGAGVTATPKDDGYVLSGAKGLVEDAHLADWFLVSAAQGDGVSQFLVPAGTDGLVVEPSEGLDVTRRLGRVRFDDVRLPASAAVGTPGEAGEAVAGQLDVAATLTAAETVGAVDRLFAMTVDYARERIAFGRPIGSFQAIKHLLADLAVYTEAAKSGVAAAARALADGRPDASETVSVVKAFVGDAGVQVAQGCFQVHGGIGFTWEHDLHLYLRRITANRVLYGDPELHHERVCTIHGL